MSDHADTPPSAPTFPRWLLTALGVAGSILIMMGVLAIAYFSAKPKQAVDADIAATRAKNLAEVQSKQSELFYSYSVSPSLTDPNQKVIRIPVRDAIRLKAAELGNLTAGKPEAPAQLSLAGSPAGFTPPAPVAPPAPAATATPPAAAAPAAAR